MGVPDMYSITVAGAENFKAALENEAKARVEWNTKWGWVLDEYRKINEELAELNKSEISLEEEIVTGPKDMRDPLPFPETENHMYGFLVEKPEFKLEIFRSPGLVKFPKKLTPHMLYDSLDEGTGKLKFWY